MGCEDQAAIDKSEIEQYLLDNNLTAESTPEGICYIIEKEGTGSRPDLSSTVTVHYEGSLLDGTIFDSSYARGQKATFPLLGVIDGWKIGIPLFKEGGKGTLLIPSELGYGSRGSGATIPGDAVLRFDIELFDVR